MKCTWHQTRSRLHLPQRTPQHKLQHHLHYLQQPWALRATVQILKSQLATQFAVCLLSTITWELTFEIRGDVLDVYELTFEMFKQRLRAIVGGKQTVSLNGSRGGRHTIWGGHSLFCTNLAGVGKGIVLRKGAGHWRWRVERGRIYSC